MIRLHDYAASANCFKVRMLLSQLEIPFERVSVDIFAGETQTEAYLASNPAGRTPLLETEDGSAIPESGAILLYLAEGTPLLPDDRIERALVHAWMFFEQNLLEPNVGTARFWHLTGRDTERPEAFARHLEAGAAALAALERGLTARRFLVGEYVQRRRLRPLRLHTRCPRGGLCDRSVSGDSRVARPGRGDAGLDRRPRAVSGRGTCRGRRPIGTRPPVALTGAQRRPFGSPHAVRS